MQYFEKHDLRTINSLELLAKQVVEGFIIGLHKSPFHGFSVEFAEHRTYNPGESTRNIDWKVYARTDKLYTKKYEEETNLRCQIVIDVSSSMLFPQNKKEKQFNKLEYAALASASLMNLLKKQRDAFGLSLFDDQLQYHTRCKSSTTHYRLLLNHLENYIVDPQLNKGTSLADSLHRIADSIHKRSMVVIFSDMLGDPSQSDLIFSALQHLKFSKHEVILFHVMDNKFELDFDFENRPYEFIDLETGEKIKLQANEVKEFYSTKAQQYKKELKFKCIQYNIDFVETNINDGFHHVLQQYLVKRKRMMI